MKKLTLIFAVLLLAACTKKEETTKNATADSSVKMDYPYQIKKPDNWEVGSPKNTMVALQALKAWEDGNLDQSLKYFGDSIHIKFDGLDKKMSNDSLKAFLLKSRNN